MRRDCGRSAFAQAGVTAARGAVRAVVGRVAGHLRNDAAGAPKGTAAIVASTAARLADSVGASNEGTSLTRRDQNVETKGQAKPLLNGEKRRDLRRNLPVLALRVEVR